MNSKQDELEISNKEVKLSILEQLQDSIQFCPSKSKNDSPLVFSSKPSAQVIVKKREIHRDNKECSIIFTSCYTGRFI